MSCGDFGGVTNRGEPCKRAAGWGVPGTDTGRCKTHLEQTPEPSTHVPPVGWAYTVEIEGSALAATSVTLVPVRLEAEPDPEPDPEPPPPDPNPEPGPHPLVPREDDDPLAIYPEGMTGHLWPSELPLSALGDGPEYPPQPMTFLVRDPAGQLWAAVELPDGRQGLWLVRATNMGRALLSDAPGSWWHVGGDAAVRVSVNVEEIELEHPGYDFHVTSRPFWVFESWNDLPGDDVRIHHVEVYATARDLPPDEEDPEPDEEPDAPLPELPAPGQPQFLRVDDDLVRITWEHSEGADAYLLNWAGGQVTVPGSPAHVDNITPGDWLCVHPIRDGVQGPAHRCNTWTV